MPERRLVLSVQTPSQFLSVDERLEQLVRDVNRELQRITEVVRDLSGESGEVPQFEENVDMTGHKIINHIQPSNLTDVANKQYVDEQVVGVNTVIEEIEQVIHNEIPPVTTRSIFLTRDLPTVVDDIIEIGNFKLAEDAHNLDISVTVSEVNFSVAKRFIIVSQQSINSDWEEVLPITHTGGDAGENFTLDAKQDDAAATLFLRLRRVAGSTAGKANIHLFQRGLLEEVFNETAGTASVTAPTTFLETTVLTQVRGDAAVGSVFGNHRSETTFTGRALTVHHQTLGAQLELSSERADADNVAIALLSATDDVATGEAAIGDMFFFRQGSTANNRGGRWLVRTKRDNGALTPALRISNRQHIGLGSKTSSPPQQTVEIGEEEVLTANVAEGFAAALRQDSRYDGAFTVTVHVYREMQNTLLTNGAAVTDAVRDKYNAAPGTHRALDGATTKATPGEVDAWEKIMDSAGNVYFVPCYLSKTS